MRTVVIDPRGAFRLERRPEPVAGPGAVVVRVRAAGLNAADLQQARGDYPAPPGWPADVPGLEVAGEVEQTGPGVTQVAPGDRVMALVGGGGHAERITVPADLLLPVPEGLSWEEAAGFPEAFSTAWDALVTQAGIRAGDRVLVTGAAGGVGTAMVQVAAVSGAHAVASVRRPGLHGRVGALAADGRVDVVTPDEEAVHAPYDVIVELVGGEDCLQRVALLRSRGTILVVGVQAGATAPLRMFDLMLARARLIGTTIRGRSPAEKALLAATVRTSVTPLLARGRLRVPVDAAFSLDRFAEAYERLAGPGKFGKVVLVP
ncbi:alcohol dehydrogenase catalytic domain-containing protein [Streptomyces morookaense]|uniref:Zinc-binding dehydrogenase n=1 Tax=Streptomyces morookaense TaxID=1970 RepID=A0A7Y7B9A8_STRMO|nr:zinc-binding dehydrogenase [Streptomyces morookaense]NVK81357.1 zinc-binding dehydrogenase [Streptomyces morookaense]GHF35623.1 zinc-binding alcohol dehydrogenase [Streptomyces morookaense]